MERVTMECSNTACAMVWDECRVFPHERTIECPKCGSQMRNMSIVYSTDGDEYEHDTTT